MTEHKKPHGKSGPIQTGGSEPPKWMVNNFPGEKAAREVVIAELFVASANLFIMSENPGQPSYRPFSNLIQNEENDLDFQIKTSLGVKQMEVAEFAPLHIYGNRYAGAPRQIDQKNKSKLLLDLIAKKSQKQGRDLMNPLIFDSGSSASLDSMTLRRPRLFALPAS